MDRGWTLLALSLGIAGCSGGADHLVVDAPRAQLFAGLVDRTRPITTNSLEAQRYFDQGMAWMFAFNHDEAIRSFARAAALDPGCAMAWWGVSLCEGPNYNDPVMTDERSRAAWDALLEARARVDEESAVERSLIDALSRRYADPWPVDRARLNRAYADAMAEVWRAFPGDADVGMLYAEALMVLTPWKLYTPDKQPAPDTPKIVAALERVLELEPMHPGANHLYIHAVEPSATPERALVAADRLCGAVPAAGHLEHMPSHIYVQVGKWREAVEQNARAMRADEKYRALSPDQGIQHMYMVHNAHMLAYSAMMIGREREAMAAARAMWEHVSLEELASVAGFVDLWMTSVYDVQKRFGRWDAILEEPPPPDFLPITTAIWRAHRAVAYAAKKDFAAAEAEYAAFRAAKADIPEDSVFGDDSTHRILDVSDRFVTAEIALQQGDFETAARLLEEAVEFEDSLSYGEPPQWLQPTRHTLGAVYLAFGRPAEAERVYRDDLSRWPRNGWSLLGLEKALERQGRQAEADAVRRERDRVWAGADARVGSSCLCLPEA